MDIYNNKHNQCLSTHKIKRKFCLLVHLGWFPKSKLLLFLAFLAFSKLIVLCEGQRNLRRHLNNGALVTLIDLTKGIKPPVLKIKSNHSDLFVQNSGMPRIPQIELNDLINIAEDRINERFYITEPSILSSGAIQVPGTQGWFLAASSRTKILAKNYSKSALVAEEASKMIVERYKLNRDQINYALPTTDVRLTSLGQNCPKKEISFPCHPAKYRSLSGHCNNVQNSDWGSSLSAYIRYAPSQYADGISLPRKSVSGDDLPSARDVSFLIHQGSETEHPHLTTLLAFFGEFVSHDLVHNAQTVGHRGHRIKCCGVDKKFKHPECFSINVKKADPLFKEMKQHCLEYVRSCSAIRTGCTLGEREQINQVTSFLDGSAIYGSSEEEANLLRSFEGGLLKFQRIIHNGKEKELLPALEGQQDCKSANNGKSKKCFQAGDIRVNENVGLTLIHTLWLREHNRIARSLQKLNPHYDDEQLFQEARKIVGAELQHIVYNELLSTILGQEKMIEYDLVPLLDGYYSGYDIDVNPGIDNAVASSVLSLFYSMLPSKFERYSQQLAMTGTRKMSETYYNPSDLYDYTKFDEYLMGFVSQNAHNFDVLVSKEMTNNIALEVKEGSDLVAVILQQGRDHGISGYTTWRRLCKIEPQINDWDDLKTIFNLTIVKKLYQLYKSVHDIDLFTGGLAEIPLRGAIVGPTFACLLATQFHYLKKGDRHWYENDLPPSTFTKDQLREIRKATLARIICDNGDDIAFVQPSSMIISDLYLNSIQYCTNFPNIDLSKWKSNEDTLMIPLSIMKEAIRRSKRQIRSLIKKVANYGIKGKKSKPSGAYRGYLTSVRAKRQTLEISNQSLVLEIVSNNFVRSLLQNNKDREKSRSLKFEIKRLMESLPKLDIDELFDSHFIEYAQQKEDCTEEILPCDHTYPFRTFTGWCNNLKHPEYGNSMKLFDRLLPPEYDDGISSPRMKGKTGKLLPNARIISTGIHYDINSPHSRYALITMQWGQFLDHDITFTPMYLTPEGSLLDCQPCDSQKTVHHECWPIPIPKNDHYFPHREANGQRKCLSFVRSINAQSKLGRREQMNQLTSFIDASNVYGSDPCDAKMLRTFRNGALNTTNHPLDNHKDLLPQTNNNPECRAPSRTCFEAGDFRSSEQPGLASMHTLFLRQHNQLAKDLSLINPHWSDEMLYQTSRKIISSIVQRITYNEFLPRVLGIDYMNKFGLTLLPSGYYNGYNENCKATVLNEFSAAVFRFGHSLIRPYFERLGKSFEIVDKPLRLRTSFFNSDMLYSAHAIDNILRGMISNSVETLDNSITEEITNHLFENKKIPFSGMDLISLNIQRARDHGIPPYNEYRVKCNLTRAYDFDDLAKEIDPNLIERLKAIYESVDDIDLFTGGLSEYPLHGGSVGPTFGCIAGIQFESFKKCDRFWHETSNPFIRFTEPQLNEIRKVTLAKIICDNSDSINMIQRNVMDLPDSFLNPRIECSSLPKLDITKWIDRGDNCLVNGKEIKLGTTERVTPCTMCACTKEGPMCNSIKVQNCFNLFILFTKQSIINDPVCKVQCAFALRVLPNEKYYHS